MSTLHCRIELNKDDKEGISISVEGDDINHLIKLNGKEIVIKSKKGSTGSTITQTPEEIKIECKRFIVEAEEISCSSKKATKCEAGSDFSISSGGNTKIEAKGNAAMKANGNIDITSSLNFTAKGSVNANLEGNITNVKGNMTNVKGSLVNLG